MGYDRELDQKVSDIFNSNATYYEMMVKWHDLHDGLAVEPEVKAIIESRCRLQANILEAGSGSGSIINWFAKKYPEVQFTGVDISRIGVEIAQRRAPANSVYHVADLKKLPFANETFSFVFSQSVIEHIVGWESALKELHRVLKPGGELLIRLENGSINSRPRIQSLLNYLLLRNRAELQSPSFRLEAGDWRQHESNFDVQEIPSDVLLRALRRSGFLISYFTTGTEHWRNSGNWRAKLISYLQFWPFNHLGSTTIVLAERPKT
jgi:ubiquinone/menaquinone biosynthesis C-methylase UbiE